MERLIHTAVSGADLAQTALRITANNLANVNTVGFKADMEQARAMQITGEGFRTRFQAQMMPVSTDLTAGAVMETGRDLDLTVADKGFIAVLDADGNEAYTRAGELQVGADGTLSVHGFPVVGGGGGIVLPEFGDIDISADGTINLLPVGGGVIEQDERIKLVTSNNVVMVKGDDGLFRAQDGNPLDADPAMTVRSGALAELPLTLEVQDLQPRREGDAVVLRSMLADGTVHEEPFDLLLAATGRRPNVDRLGLEHTALPLDPHGVPVYDRRTGQVGSSAVFMAGDAADDRPLLHEAADEGRIAGDNAGRWPDLRLRPRRAPLAVVFSEPQMALVGATHAELVASGTEFEIGDVSFADQGRSRVMGRNQGALQVYAERGSGRLLGAELIGPAAEHLGHLLAWSVQRGDTVQQMLDSPFYHPVVEEGLRTALRDAQRALKLAAPALEDCLECHT